MIEAYCDGSGSNPQGIAAASFIIVSNQSIIHQDTAVLRNVTNNVAEYTALKMAIEWAHDNGYDYLHCYSDSALVVNQLNETVTKHGKYRTKNVNLVKLKSCVLSYIRDHNLGVTIRHVPRTNQWIGIADQLNRQAVAGVVL